MSVGASDLLRALGSGVQPGSGVSGGRGAGPIEGAGFASLLEQARAGGIESGRAVEVQPGLEIELTPSELRSVAGAVDRAAGAGAARALVLLGERALEVDVLTRRIVGERNLRGGAAATGIDAVVVADAGGGLLGAGEPASASLLRLAGRTDNEGVRRVRSGVSG